MRLSILLIILFCSPVQAGRVMRHYMVKNFTEDMTGALSVGRTTSIYCENLSNLPQTVTVTTMNQKADATLCVFNLSGFSGWTPISGCFYTFVASSIPDYSETKVIPVGGWTQFDTFVGVSFSPTGAKLATTGQPGYTGALLNNRADRQKACTEPPNATLPNCVSYANGSLSFNVKINIAEDRGAILCGLRSIVNMGGAGAATPDNINQSVNGGRPF